MKLRWPGFVLVGLFLLLWQSATVFGWIDSVNPCARNQVVGRASKASQAEAEQALDAAWTSFEDWSRWQPAERARLLLKENCCSADLQVIDFAVQVFLAQAHV